MLKLNCSKAFLDTIRQTYLPHKCLSGDFIRIHVRVTSVQISHYIGTLTRYSMHSKLNCLFVKHNKIVYLITVSNVVIP